MFSKTCLVLLSIFLSNQLAVCEALDDRIVFPGGREDIVESPVQISGLRSQLRNSTSRRRIPAPPVPAGNLSTPLGDAVCYSVDNRFYCVSQFRASHSDALKYCRETKTKLVYFENQDEQERLYDFLSNSPSSFQGFPRRTDLNSSEDYVDYVMENASPGLIVRCSAFCGTRLRPDVHFGRVMDRDYREFVGAVVKVQWTLDNNERIQRWYPAGNLELVGYHLNQQRILTPANEERVTVEPGHRVVILKQSTSTSQVQFPDLTKSSSLLQEIGIVQDVDTVKKIAWVYFPAFNTRWQGPVTDLEVLDRRRVVGTYWTAGSHRNDRGWTWASVQQKSLDAFSNWAPGMPRNSKANSCIEIRYHKYGFWYNARCSNENYFICKK